MARPVCLVVDFIYPPIPTRAFDWCVYVDGEEERGENGFGPTREAAVANWFEQYGEEEEFEPLADCGSDCYDLERHAGLCPHGKEIN